MFRSNRQLEYSWLTYKEAPLYMQRNAVAKGSYMMTEIFRYKPCQVIKFKSTTPTRPEQLRRNAELYKSPLSIMRATDFNVEPAVRLVKQWPLKMVRGVGRQNTIGRRYSDRRVWSLRIIFLWAEYKMAELAEALSYCPGLFCHRQSVPSRSNDENKKTHFPLEIVAKFEVFDKCSIASAWRHAWY